MIRFPFAEAPDEGQATEVAPGVLWMRLPLPMALDHVNIYALDDGDGWTVVDTGIASQRGVAIWERLLAGPLGGKPVRRVIVTHHHPDHVGMAGWFQARGAELLMTRTAWLYARMLVLDVQEKPTAEQIAFWQQAGMDPALLEKRSGERAYNFIDAVAPMPLGFTRMVEGDVIAAGGRDWTVRLGSGHAPDHATLWSTDGEVVLGGDQLLPGISANIGVYPTEPAANPLQDWMDSTQAFAPFATDHQLVLPGHKLPYRGLPFRLTQMVVNHESALARLRGFLAVPATAAQCFAPLFRREVAVGEYGLALVEAVAHLNYLLQRREVSRTLRADGTWVWMIRNQGMGMAKIPKADGQKENGPNAEGVDVCAPPRARVVHSDPKTPATAEQQPMPDAFAERGVDKKSAAEWMYDRLILYIRNFESQLDSAHEIAMGFAGGDAGVLRIEGLGYFDPDIVTFYGRNEDGSKTQLIQHVTQVSVILRAVRKDIADEPARRIGFRLSTGWEGGESGDASA